MGGTAAGTLNELANEAPAAFPSSSLIGLFTFFAYLYPPLRFVPLRFATFRFAISYMSSPSTDNVRKGLHLLTDPPNSSVENSWQSDNGVFWLQDLLPAEMPVARIFSFRHDSRWEGSETPLTEDISEHGEALIQALTNKQQLTDSMKKPIIFIGHSLGGLVIETRVGHLERHSSIKISTHGILFLGTPHQGGGGLRRSSSCPRSNQYTHILIRRYSNRLAVNLNGFRHCSTIIMLLVRILTRFSSTSVGRQTFSTRYPFFSLGPNAAQQMVPKYSATIPGAVNSPSIGLDADHISMVKYANSSDYNFRQVVERLQIFGLEVDAKVKRNWLTWSTCKEVLKGGDVTSPKTTEFSLGRSLERARNHQFVGRQETLSRLHKMLTNSENRDRPNVVVLYGIGGVGKTEIATEYAYRTKKTHRTAFWINGSSKQLFINSILNCLETIKRHYENHGITNPVYHRIVDTLEATVQKDEVLQTDGLVREFLGWLSLEANRSWLLVIDNVDDLESFNFQELLPTTSWGSILVTSRRPDLAILWTALEVTDIDEDDAMKLLQTTTGLNFRNSNKGEYNARQPLSLIPILTEMATVEFESGRKLIGLLGNFPLAIAQAGSYILLIETYRTLSRTTLNDIRHIINGCSEKYPQRQVRQILTAYLPIAIGANYTGFGPELQVREAFDILVSYSFFRRQGDDCFSIHPLVQLWARVRKPEEQEILARTAMALLNAKGAFNEWRDMPSHKDHVLRILEDWSPCSQSPEDSVDLSEYLGGFSWSSTVFSRAAHLFTGWRLWVKDFLGQANRRTFQREPLWEMLCTLGFSNMKEGQVRLLQWTTCLAKAHLPTKHPRVVDMLRSYTSAKYTCSIQAQGWLNVALDEETMAWHLWVLDAAEQVLGKTHRKTEYDSSRL
ncbi:eukaryotic translation initiation factor 3 [Colletotrichum sojae]|uniref:Eukaryotic translation initiation factor 3 n=1 Tax=Colletotrichum sojae TaxID=2175907 RepID=A0A8H6IW44_9PEZI|nr:eukaryotic translation initiation factor 3 [Colletotrichum sojae]